MNLDYKNSSKDCQKKNYNRDKLRQIKDLIKNWDKPLQIKVD